MMRRRPKLKALAALGVVMVCAAACNPGWINPMVGASNAFGQEPGNVAIANEDVALHQPDVVAALPGGGSVVYDRYNCTLVKAGPKTSTLLAGIPGSCGHTGDGGPATAAKIGIFGLGTGLWVDAADDVYFTTDNFQGVRRIDGTTGVITTVPVTIVTAPGGYTGSIGGGSLAPDGTFTYMEWEQLGGENALDIRRIDPSGHDVSLFAHAVAGAPVGLFQTGPEQYATSIATNSPAVLRVDLASGTVTSTPVDGSFTLNAAAADGTLYGNEQGQIVRLDPDNTMSVIAGLGGVGDRQMGDALKLGFAAYNMAIEPNGNLLFTSDNVVYEMIDPGHAPVKAAAS